MQFSLYKKIFPYLFILTIALSRTNCSPLSKLSKNSGSTSGFTMGTTYHISWHNFSSSKNKTPLAKQNRENDKIKKQIKNKLLELNKIYSTFLPKSEISKFNNSISTKYQKSSKILYTVLKEALTIARLSNGAYDPTLGPLIDLWGFGKKSSHIVPSKKEIKENLQIIGYKNIELKQEKANYYIKKKKGGIQINLSSLAKGHGVDEIARLLEKEKWQNYLVEIGGEIQTKGKASENRKWKIGINKPKPSSSPNEIYKVLSIEKGALATSGTYRNFFKAKNIAKSSKSKGKQTKSYSHILDGRTGYPIEHSIVSVSIIAKNCMLADGLATMALVLGKESIPILKKIPNIQYLLIEDKENSLVEIQSSAWPK